MRNVELVIESCLKRAENELPGFRLKDLGPADPFFGGVGAALDSLNLVSFIFILEDEFKKITGNPIKVSTQDILNKEEAPFKTINSLSQWLSKRT